MSRAILIDGFAALLAAGSALTHANESPHSCVGWVERERNPSPATAAMGFARLNASYASLLVNDMTKSEH